MHRLGAARLAGRNDLLDVEITLGCGRRADRNRRVGHLDMKRVAVGIGINCDRRDAHASRRLDNPTGDLTAIGNQDSFEHAR